MASFDIAYALVAGFEGAYSNDPSDRGGETYAGIARNFFPHWVGWQIVDAEKRNGMNGLSRRLGANSQLQRQVAAWYREEWFDALGLGSLEQELANEIFEQSVNLGKAGCGKKVQTVCNAYNYQGGKPLFTDLTIDGTIGRKTLTALAKIVASGKASAESLVHALNCMQGAHYLELAAKKPSQRKYTVGWMKRTHCEG